MAHILNDSNAQGLSSIRAGRVLLACLFVLFLSGWVAAQVQSDWGRVHVQSIKIPTQNGQWVVADLFRPRAASAESPAPFIAVVPGFQRSKEALSNIALELARRGFVTASIDPYAQGSSSASLSRIAATTEGYGLFALIDYVASSENLNYVDKSRIGATGHSAGGNAAIRAANYFGREAIQTGMRGKLDSVYVSGYVLTLRDDVLADVRSNVGVAYALYDEGAYRNELGHGDMRSAPEALRAVNSGLPADQAVNVVDIGRYYGDKQARTLRVVHNERVLHPFQPYMAEATANQIAYFEHVFDWSGELSPYDQVWQWKEFLGVVSLIAGLVALVPMGQLLLSTPWFSSLVKPVPPSLPKPSGRGRRLFWGTFVFAALVACFTYIPMAELSQKLFVAASTRQLTWFFPQRMNNAVMLWAILNGTVGFVVFWLSYRNFGRVRGVSPTSWGLQVTPAEFGRTLAAALILFVGFFLTLFALYYFLHVDYRFLFMGVRVFQPELLLLLAMYVPLFFVFFLSNSLRINGAMRFTGQPEWRSMLLGGIANSLGLLLIVVVQYVTYAATGTVYWTDGWLYVNLLFGVVPMMFILPYFNRYFFRMTGRIYLGPMVTCLVFVMILISNTVIYLPL